MIAIDLIGMQTASRYRGIGKYIQALLPALERHQPGNLVYWWHRGLPRPDMSFGSKVPLVERLPAGVDWVLLTSPFEGGVKYQIPPACGPHRMATILYDFIPLIWPEQYLHGPAGQYYTEQLGKLLHYDRFLAISDAVLRDACERVAIPEHKLTAIGGGLFDTVVPLSESRGTLPFSLEKRPYVLSVVTSEPHKNAAGLVDAFACIDPRLRANLSLVLVSSSNQSWFVEALKVARARGIDVIYVIRPDDATVARLMRQCQLFVMPSRYEGFGLPALEAMACGVPVIAGANSAQLEVVGDGGLLVDVSDLQNLTRAMTDVLEQPALAAELRQAGPVRAALFNWDNVALSVLAALTD